jgi:hypothetical protein
MGILYVANKGDSAFCDRYNGEDFVIEPRQTVEISYDAARHFFGYGESDKTRALTRQGVIRLNSELETKGAQWLSNFVFQEQEPPEAPDLIGPEPKAPKRARGLDDLMSNATQS